MDFIKDLNLIDVILFLVFIGLSFYISFFTKKLQEKGFNLIKNSKFILTFISVYTVIFLIVILYSIFSLKIVNILGIDFIGGTLTEVAFKENIDNSKILDIYKKYNKDKELIIQEVILPSNEYKRVVVLKNKPMDELEKNKINKDLENIGGIIRRSENISSSISKQTLTNAFIALFIALIAQIIYIGFRFGNNILYGIIADIALLHDVIVMLGIYVILGLSGFAGFEINSIFLAAVLTVVGYSVMDTIIIFDRIRENIKIEINNNNEINLNKFEELVNKSVIQTITRSVFTTLTVLLTLFGIIFLGGETLRSFSIALAVGTFSGAFSSIFIAAPLVSLLKHKILPKDIKNIKQEEQETKSVFITPDISSIFAHQEELPQDIKQQINQKDNSEILEENNLSNSYTKNKKSVLQRYKLKKKK
jgi:preprotein translocase subunit SecF